MQRLSAESFRIQFPCSLLFNNATKIVAATLMSWQIVALSSEDAKHFRLTKLNKAVREFEESEEAPVLCGGGTLQRRERHVEHVLRGVDDEVPHLTAVRPYLRRELVGTVIDRHIVKRAAVKNKKQIENEIGFFGQWAELLLAAWWWWGEPALHEKLLEVCSTTYTDLLCASIE